jgi:hypothetical protein
MKYKKRRLSKNPIVPLADKFPYHYAPGGKNAINV